MKVRSPLFFGPAAASLWAGLLCCAPSGDQHAQIFVGGTNATTTTSTSTISIGQGKVVSSEASQGNVRFSGCGNTIAADSVKSRATAACSPNGPTVSGECEITGLVINDQSVAISGQANQKIVLSDGTAVLVNEQTAAQTATTADITVNPIHVVGPCAGVDVTFGSASARISCEPENHPPPPPCEDFLTGGGWITGTPSGALAVFSVAGGIKDGAFWGHFFYLDYGDFTRVRATAVTGYAIDPDDPDCRIIDYNVLIDDEPGTARLHLCDKGMLFWNDLFEMQLSNGVASVGDLGSRRSGVGNIQLHSCPQLRQVPQNPAQ